MKRKIIDPAVVVLWASVVSLTYTFGNSIELLVLTDASDLHRKKIRENLCNL